MIPQDPVAQMILLIQDTIEVFEVFRKNIKEQLKEDNDRKQNKK